MIRSGPRLSLASSAHSTDYSAMSARGIRPAKMGLAPTRADLFLNADAFKRSLEYEGRSPKTIDSYAEATTQLAKYVTEAGMPLSVASLTREHMRASCSISVSAEGATRRSLTATEASSSSSRTSSPRKSYAPHPCS
jgi:hypothetical protein